jgi:hypothetical protein
MDSPPRIFPDGKEHTSGTATGLIALAVEGAPLDLFEPEMPAG